MKILTFFLILFGILGFGFCNGWNVDQFSVSPENGVLIDSGKVVEVRFTVVDPERVSNIDTCFQMSLWYGNTQVDPSPSSSPETLESTKCCTRFTRTLESVSKEMRAANCKYTFREIFRSTPDFLGGSVSLSIKLGDQILKTFSVNVFHDPKYDYVVPSLDPVSGNLSAVAFVDRMIGVIFWLASSLAFMMIIVGGFMMTTAMGDPQRISKGRNTVFYAIAGFAIMSVSRGIVALVQAIMGVRK
jgi:hypothetical protein